MAKYCHMVMVLLTLPKLMIMAGFFTSGNVQALMQKNTIFKKAITGQALTSHICNFRPNILLGWGAPEISDIPCRILLKKFNTML